MGGGVPVSMKGTVSMAQLLLFQNWLPMTVSNRPPEITNPTPIGPSSAEPEAGAVVSLLSCTWLWRKIQHEVVPVGPVSESGQCPLWGDGASSLFWLLVEKPVLLFSNSEFWMTSRPPELVPE